VFTNVWLPLRLTGVSKEKARPRIEEALEQVGLAGFAKAYPRQLSGGMKMRVSIARALVTRPTVLLMDEPFAALDEITRLKLNDDLAALRTSLGATVVFVTHSVFESVYLSDRIVVMAARPGRAVAEINVESPTETRQEGFRLCKEYADTCVQTSEALHVAMGDRPPKMLKGGMA
jgi:NitT/TauT family transport system ATP-binding protein